MRPACILNIIQKKVGMANQARNHHYVPQAYLRAFTDGGSKKSTLNVYDVITGDRFETIPRNVCAIRDFNRISVPGFPSDYIESEMGKFESMIVPAVTHIKADNEFRGEPKSCILNLIALLATRHPARRETTRKFHEKIAKMTMGMVLQNRERYEKTISDMNNDGVAASSKATYEEMKDFVAKGEYEIEVTTEHHINLEGKMHEAALEVLHQRNWTLFKAGKEDGHFITSDWPVSLEWSNPETVPPFYRSSPGLGLKGTEVVFPLTKELALLGTFDGKDETLQASPHLVAAVNSRTLRFSRNQVYSPKRWFPALSDGAIVVGAELIQKLCR